MPYKVYKIHNCSYVTDQLFKKQILIKFIQQNFQNPYNQILKFKLTTLAPPSGENLQKLIFKRQVHCRRSGITTNRQTQKASLDSLYRFDI